ncbi:MAG: aspartate aminotransferase family protein [Sandaracinus sp.]|nr:aspartate aminotransferase family protein [Sandaracinus sp.]|tara:strand:+ start:242 stop:1705 length:1464 start_codon:yes stop_codon:yes gene_type:complete
MGMPKQRKSREEVLGLLREAKKDDLPIGDGRSFGYIYSAGEAVDEVKKAAMVAALGANGLDPTVWPSLRQMENEIIAMAREHLHGDESVVGSFTSGGTESLLLAVKTARDHARATKPPLPAGTRPTMLLPETAHASFQKAAAYFDVEPVMVRVDPETFVTDVDDMRAKIDERTILLVGSSPGYAHGVMDPIEAIGALAVDRELLFHVDGCIGAFLLPHLERLGAEVPPFDFRVPGVTSMSMDLHKYAYAPKGSSVLLYRSAALRHHQYFACAAWSGYSMVNATFQSTKSAAPLAGAWAVMHFLGDEGYLELAEGIHRSTRELIDGLRDIEGLRVLGDPIMGLVAVTAAEGVQLPIFRLADAMSARGWYVQPQLGYGSSPRNLHFQIEPSNTTKVGEMLEALREETAKLLGQPDAAPAPLLQMVATLTPEDARTKFGELMAMAGSGGPGDLPNARALVNEVMDALPAETRQELLKAFMGQIYTPPTGA